MTYDVVAEEDPRLAGDYVKLEEGDGDAVTICETETSSSCGGGGGGAEWWWSLWWWAKLVLVVVFVSLLGAIFFKWVGPFLMDKVNFLRNYTRMSLI